MIISSYNIEPSCYSGLKMRKLISNRGMDVSGIIKQGDKFLQENKFKEALSVYNRALDINEDDINIYKKMAKAQYGLKDYVNAEKNFKIYLEENQQDTDILIELGETQRLMGHYGDALKNFETAYSYDKSNDLARRSILLTKNYILAAYSPERAQREKAEYAQNNLKNALNMTIEYMTPKYMNELKSIKFQFGETSKMGGTSNIAQYENSKKTITVSDSYIYASPQVIAAYITHEAVHAHDNDAYTSVKEEQDAYETATKFWIENSNGVKDPEMDYAKELYEQSPSALSDRVEEIYKLRDPEIAMTSPNHPPDKSFRVGKMNNKAASQSIRTYDVIA